MTFFKVFRAAVVATCIAGASAASTITDQFTSLWILGDSLSGYIGPPGDPNTQRSSDGPLWSEQIVTDFLNAGKEAESFAFPGATAGLNRANPIIPTLPYYDLTTQVDRLLQEKPRFGSTPLVSLWIGGNDVGVIAGGLPSSTTVGEYGTALNRLVAAGVSDFLLFEVPDIGFTPLVQDPNSPLPPAVATGISQGLNDAFFNLVVPTLPKGVNVTRIDTFALTKTAFQTPDFFGADRTGPCVVNRQPVDDCSQTAFFDAFHPTALLHDFVAHQVRAAYIAPIPLPAAGWMLLAALGTLVVVRRRHRAVAC